MVLKRWVELLPVGVIVPYKGYSALILRISVPSCKTLNKKHAALMLDECLAQA